MIFPSESLYDGQKRDSFANKETSIFCVVSFYFEGLSRETLEDSMYSLISLTIK